MWTVNTGGIPVIGKIAPYVGRPSTKEPTKIPLTIETLWAIKKDYAEGMKFYSIAKKYNIGVQIIKNILLHGSKEI